MTKIRFDVFGREIEISRTDSGWKASLVGGDGKSRPADFPIPADLTDGELLGYLDDLFHEYASAENPTVTRVQERGSDYENR